MDNLKQITVNLRHTIIKYLMKLIAPKLYERLGIRYYNRNKKRFTKTRPSILFIKDYFKNKKLIGLEVGVKYGDHSKNILETLNMKKLYLMDIWLINDQFLEAYMQLKDKNVIFIKKDSGIGHKLLLDNFFDFIYIDAEHSYNSVYNDICNFYSKVKTNGILAGHDFDLEGVRQAVNNFCKENQIYFFFLNKDWWFIK